MSKEKTLKFNKWFYQPIKDEIKTTTIRTEHKDLCEGDSVKFHFIGSYDKNLSAEITCVKRIRYGNLTDKHAKAEGYRHVDLLKKELNEIYTGISNDDELYIISFELEDSLAKQITEAIVSSIEEIL